MDKSPRDHSLRWSAANKYMQEAGRGGDAFLTLKVSWSSICSTARQSAEYCVPPICTKRDVVQRSCACPIHGDIQGQMGWGPGQPALVSGNMPIATLWVLRSLPTQAVLLFNDSYSSQEKEKSSQTAIGTFKSVFIDMTQLTRICPSGVQESVTTGHISHGNALQDPSGFLSTQSFIIQALNFCTFSALSSPMQNTHWTFTITAELSFYLSQHTSYATATRKYCTHTKRNYEGRVLK